MQEFAEIVGLFLFSAFKFFFAPSASILLGLGFFKTLLITTSGGLVGFFLFFFFGNWLNGFYTSLIRKKAKPSFSKKNRMIIRMKSTYGFWGLVILTPCLFGIPLGSILASAFYAKERKLIPAFILSILSWSFILTYFTSYIKNI